MSEIEAADNAHKWSPFEVIDCHGHIGSFAGYDLSMPTLLSNIERWGVKLVLVSNIDGADLPDATKNLDEVATNRATEKIVVEHWNRLRGILWARPIDGSAQTLEAKFLGAAFAKTHRGKRIFVAMKFHPEFNHFEADSPEVDPYLALCEKYQLPAVFHCGSDHSNSSAERIYSIARRHPKVPVVLYHMGFGTQHQQALKVVAQSMERKDADLYLDTAQADSAAVSQAVKQLGAKKVLFGTDATYYGKEHYSQYSNLVETLRKSLPLSDFQAIMHGNATRLFHLH